MLVHSAASELNTQPVHKIPFINALLAHARVPTLSSTLSLTDGRDSVAAVFFFSLYISFNSFVLHVADALRLVSLIDIIFLSFIDIQRHSVRYILPDYDFASARTPLERLAIDSCLICISFALLTYLFVILILMLFVIFLSLTRWHVSYVYRRFVLYLIG